MMPLKKNSNINIIITKLIINSKHIAIMLVNTEVNRIIVYLKNFLSIFTIDWTMIIILSQTFEGEFNGLRENTKKVKKNEKNLKKW